ncbi:hypothetical protein SDC9_126328 [bioreactor metagenome]|uniref:Uncharacterized protein n=1 Tax=bioreactor metagenome TaxID=1076179 RepID=A0A645CQW5_9ZZZZ
MQSNIICGITQPINTIRNLNWIEVQIVGGFHAESSVFDVYTVVA